MFGIQILKVFLLLILLSADKSFGKVSLNVGIVLPEEQRGGPIDQGYRWGITYLNKLNSTPTLISRTLYVKPGESFRASKELCKLLGTGIIAILGGRSDYDPSLEWKLFWTSASLDVPLFFATPSFAKTHAKSSEKITEEPEEPTGILATASPRPEFAVRLAPPLKVWGLLLREFTRYLGLQKVAVLYEDEKGLMRTQALLREPSPVEHIIVRRVRPETYQSVLADAKGREIRHLIIDCPLTSLESLLTAIKELHMSGYKYHFLLTNLDMRTADVKGFIAANVNLTAFQILNPDVKIFQDKLTELKELVLEANSTIGEETVIKTDTALAFDSVLALGQGLVAMGGAVKPENLSCDTDAPWKEGLTLLNYITASEFRGLSGHVSFQEGDRSNLKLDIIRLTTVGWRRVGHWTPERKLNITKPKAFWDFGLINSTLVVTCVLEAPYVQLRQGVNLTGNSRFEGFSVDLLKLISNLVGFDYILEVVPDGRYGVYDQETGEWNGVIKQLTDKSVDLGIGALTITHARELVIDFTKPFMHFGISILFRKPARRDTGVFTFLKPLAWEIWLSVAVSYLLVSLTMFIVARFSPNEWSRTTTAMSAYGVRNAEGLVRNQFSISNALWYPIGTLMQQGSDLNPKSTSTRIVGGIWWFFSIVIVSSYTANLAAFLTVQRLANPIESAKDLVEQSEVSYGSLEAGSTMAYFRDSKIETYQKMWRFMESRKPSVFTATYADGVRKVLEGNYAFLMESTTIAYVMAQNCNLTQIGGLLNSKGYGIALPKGSPWKDKISLAILQLQEKGVIGWYQDIWWAKRANPEDPYDLFCNKEYKKDTTASALGVDSIGGIFLVLVIGLVLAAIVALTEFLCSSKKTTTRSEEVTLCTEMSEEAKFAVHCSAGRRRLPAISRHCESCERSRSETPIPQIEIPTPPPPPTSLPLRHFDFDFQDEGGNVFSPAYEVYHHGHHHHHPEESSFGIRNRASVVGGSFVSVRSRSNSRNN